MTALEPSPLMPASPAHWATWLEVLLTRTCSCTARFEVIDAIEPLLPVPGPEMRICSLPLHGLSDAVSVTRVVLLIVLGEADSVSEDACPWDQLVVVRKSGSGASKSAQTS